MFSEIFVSTNIFSYINSIIILVSVVAIIVFIVVIIIVYKLIHSNVNNLRVKPKIKEGENQVNQFVNLSQNEKTENHEEETTLYCTFCGGELSKSLNYCPSCGDKID